MKDNQGAILITFIIFFTIAGILASSIAYMLQNIPTSLKSVNSVEQSYYLSESGLRYISMKIKDGKDYSELKAYYENDHRTIHIPLKALNYSQTKDLVGHVSWRFRRAPFHQRRRDMFIHSNAQVDLEHFVTSKRQLNAEYNDPNDYSIDFEKDHFDQDADDTDRLWNLTDSFYANIHSKYSLQLKSNQQKNWCLASLNWGKNENKLPDLRLYQYSITKVLSYKIQIKLNPYPGRQKRKDFMTGLNFRVMNSIVSYNRERIEYYGVSLFKSKGRQQGNPPCWLTSDSNDCIQHLGNSFCFEGEENEECTSDPERYLKPNTPYVIFWVKEEHKDIELIAYCNLALLANSNEYVEKLNNSIEWGFKDWLNMGIFLKEKESAGQKLNDIQIGLRAEDKKDWDFPLLTFLRIDKSDLPVTTLSDRTLVSRDLYNLNEIPPDEIGFHALYDNRILTSSKYDIFFKEFLLDCHGDYCHEKSESLYVQF